MIWAKIVNNEIMQTHDEDPSGLWHPDQIAKNDLPGYWEQVPDHVNVGWKFKNDEWISGGQWLEEHIAENPPPPPGCIFIHIISFNKSSFIISFSFSFKEFLLGKISSISHLKFSLPYFFIEYHNRFPIPT